MTMAAFSRIFKHVKISQKYNFISLATSKHILHLHIIIIRNKESPLILIINDKHKKGMLLSVMFINSFNYYKYYISTNLHCNLNIFILQGYM